MRVGAIHTILLICFILALSSCSSYKAVRQPNLAFDLQAQQNKVISEGISVMVKPMYEKTELENYFDNDLMKYNILPVQVSLVNKSDKSVFFNTDGINLIGPNNNRSPVLSTEAVLDKLKKSYWRSAGWGAAFGIFGIIPSVINVSNTNKKMTADYESRAIKGGNLTPGAMTDGLAFFSVPDNLASLGGWKLSLVFQQANGDPILMDYGMSGTVVPRKKPQGQQGSKTAKTEKTPETIKFRVIGYCNGGKKGPKVDRAEAVLDAKQQALQIAGIKVAANDVGQIEAEANKAILPGFEMIDTGYEDSGSYKVVLFGEVKTPEAVEKNKEM